jgi:hypothetical protein
MCQQFLIKLPSIKFHKNLHSGSQVVHCGKIDKHGTANKHIFATLL